MGLDVGACVPDSHGPEVFAGDSGEWNLNPRPPAFFFRQLCTIIRMSTVERIDT